MVRTFVTPMVMMFLMFIIVISTSSPLLNSVMEEKMTRISEVLLGSVTPFQLMMGKLLGVVGVRCALADLRRGRLRRGGLQRLRRRGHGRRSSHGSWSIWCWPC